MKRNLNPILVAVILVGLVLTGAGSLSACGLLCDAGKYRDTVQPYVVQWHDAVELTFHTPRMALALQIKDLQKIRARVAALQSQSCFSEDHKLLLQAMDYEIDGFNRFLAQEPDATVTRLFDQSDEYMNKWSRSISKK